MGITRSKKFNGMLDGMKILSKLHPIVFNIGDEIVVVQTEKVPTEQQSVLLKSCGWINLDTKDSWEFEN
jgi:hypothetical protein